MTTTQKEDAAKCLSYIMGQGMIVDTSPENRKIAKSVLLPAFKVFRDMIVDSSIRMIYLYDKSIQPTEVKNDDGKYSFTQIHGNKISCIGISIQALTDQGEDYAILVFLHELAHELYVSGATPVYMELHDCEHDAIYMAILDRLIQIFNEQTGRTVKNSYKEMYKHVQ